MARIIGCALMVWLRRRGVLDRGKGEVFWMFEISGRALTRKAPAADFDPLYASAAPKPFGHEPELDEEYL